MRPRHDVTRLAARPVGRPATRPATRARLHVRALAVLGAVALAAPHAAWAQQGGGAAPAEPAANAPAAAAPATTQSPLVVGAREAQREFERARRLGLRFYNGGAMAACDERIGRLCYWNNNGDVPAPDERTEVKRERAALLERLDAAAAADPADDWTAGMRVRYLVEDRRLDDAERAARACRGTPWWCSAVLGLALHERGEHAGAERAYAAAVAAMPEAERCRWTDVSLWLDERTRDYYKGLSCPQRGAWERRFWTLAQPLYLLPGNDVRTELLARRTYTRIEAQGGNSQGMPWGDDIEESELRYGVPTAWSLSTRGAADPTQSVIGHEPTPSYDFMPRGGALAAPTDAAAGEWALGEAKARMRYAPRYARRGFVALTHQVARFRRGDSTLVVGAFDAGGPEWGSGRVRGGLFLLDSTAAVVARATRDSLPTRAALAVAMSRAPRLMSLEALGVKQERAGRARYAVQPLPDTARLSDLLVLSRGVGAAPSFDSALVAVRGAPVVRAGGTMGLYWESYVAAGQPATVSITATRVNAGRTERLAGALRIGSRTTPVSVRFVDNGRPDGQPGRAIALTWPEVPAGTYRLMVMMTGSGQSARSETLITVEE
jgi:hypothetical protein